MHLLSPQLESRVVQKQTNQKASYDRRSQTREFHVGTVRNMLPGSKYVPGVIVERLGPLSYLVSVQDGVTWHRHVDHIKSLAPSDNPLTVQSIWTYKPTIKTSFRPKTLIPMIRYPLRLTRQLLKLSRHQFEPIRQETATTHHGMDRS